MLKKIASFTINHLTLTPGLYVSRVDGDCVTYDLRMKKPNAGDYVAVPAMHTIEHLIATFVRSGEWSDQVVYFGPMGCRTGYYLVVRDAMSKETVLAVLKEAFRFAAAFEGEIPGAKEIECGNYLEHDLVGGKKEAAAYEMVLEGLGADWTGAYPD